MAVHIGYKMSQTYNALANGYESFSQYRLKSVVLWATESGQEHATVRHWMSSFPFEEALASDIISPEADLTTVPVTGLA